MAERSPMCGSKQCHHDRGVRPEARYQRLPPIASSPSTSLAVDADDIERELGQRIVSVSHRSILSPDVLRAMPAKPQKGVRAAFATREGEGPVLSRAQIAEAQRMARHCIAKATAGQRAAGTGS